jgi:hypothetical protein
MEKHNDYKLKNPVDRMEKGSKMAKKGKDDKNSENREKGNKKGSFF